MAKKKKILIVDDEVINLDVLEANLDSFGFEVLRSRDGREAKKIAGDEHPDMVITDILMPNMDGFQLCREMKTNPDLSGIPVVFYTATYTDDSDRDLALRLGAARFVQKPEEPNRLEATVREVFEEQDCLSNRIDQDPDLDNETFLSTYNSRLVNKLEQKLTQLDLTQYQLQHEVERSKTAETKVRNLAFFDIVTGLANRAHFLDSANQVFSLMVPSTSDSIIVVGIDDFWRINHTLGQEKGNILLTRIADRLKSIAHEKRFILGRIADDAFAIMAQEFGDREHIIEQTLDIIDQCDVAYEVDSLSIEVTLRTGISLHPDHGNDAETLVRHAEVALRQAKVDHSKFSIYDPGSDPFQPQRLELLKDLRDAIKNNHLDLHFQPKVDMRTGRFVAAEALMRWHHPQRGDLAPGSFLAIAEQTGQMRTLNGLLLREAVQQSAAWQRQGFDLGISLNISVYNLVDEELPDAVSALLTQEGLTHHHLTFEVMESALLRKPQQAARNMKTMAEMGIKFAIDDFGTGFSSLWHLRNLPVNELKIDKSFIQDMTAAENDQIIVKSTIDLAHNLGLKVTAEGVEHRQTYELLRSLDCDLAQGYYLGRPMPAENFVTWLQDKNG